jgi:hypothetical protein
MSDSTIFFSYSRSDSEFAIKLAKDLREKNVNLWIDQLDIMPGLRWDAEIEKALAQSHYLLVILSPKAVSSENVMDEVAYALEEGKRIIPIVIIPCTIPFRIRRIQRIDFETDYTKALVSLLKVVKAVSLDEDIKSPRFEIQKPKAIAPKLQRVVNETSHEHEEFKNLKSGFISAEGINKIVNASLYPGEKVKGNLLIFKTRAQHTWLVATDKQLFCLLDDKDTRAKENLVMWQVPLKDARKKITARPHKEFTGLVDIGQRKNWLYSTSIYPYPDLIVKEVKKLVS